MSKKSGAGATSRDPAGKQSAKQPAAARASVVSKSPGKKGKARQQAPNMVLAKETTTRKAGANKAAVKQVAKGGARKTPLRRTTGKAAPRQIEKKVAFPTALTTQLGDGTTAGGSAGFRGYLYQADVSVWAALDLVLAKGMASSIEVEPASQEDVEAWLTGSPPPPSDPTDPGRMSLRAQVAERPLVIQAKLTATGDWSHSAIARLLEHGGPQRRSAKERLETPNLEYLLITSGPLTGVARTLSVRGFTEKLEPPSMPASLVRLLPAEAAGRVKVIEAYDEERIASRVRELLVEAMKVPLANRDACFANLRDVARLKMTGREARTWTFDELAEVIGRHGGVFGDVSGRGDVHPARKLVAAVRKAGSRACGDHLRALRHREDYDSCSPLGARAPSGPGAQKDRG